MPIFSSTARVLIRCARTMLRTAFMERSIAWVSDAGETEVIELAPIVGGNVWENWPRLKASGGWRGNGWVTMWANER